MERKSPAGIQLDFLLSAKWEITGLSFRNNASDPLYRHLADCDPDAGSEGCRRSGTETKESSEDGISEKGRRVLALGIFILLGILGYLKYFDFFTVNLSHLFGHPVLEGWRPENLLMPIGISFYTLQAIGYMTDVYWGTIQAETEIWRTALFLGFFPQIME